MNISEQRDGKDCNGGYTQGRAANAVDGGTAATVSQQTTGFGQKPKRSMPHQFHLDFIGQFTMNISIR